QRRREEPLNGALGKRTELASPWDLVVHDGTLFISMAGIHQIWALDLESNTISVFVGDTGGRIAEGKDDGARLNRATRAQPSGMTTDGEYPFWVDGESRSIRRVALASDNSPVETLAGKALYAYGDLDGPSRDALFQHPQGVAFADGGLFVADTYNHKVRVLDL